ncbi:MAG: AAA family ATPase [Gammaproteobacteria bacterium]
MRLSKIKLSGFKTFVEPTTLSLPSTIVGIVGPNGCGKSNVIDAVRWVLGESSAKYLRGESMSDVIFNGSSSRKPVSTATIELLFDNTDKKVGGEYSKYNEISTKRVITRDGQSRYFLNGTKCRRKDITTLFLGTGLGPRSYAIVQQDTISRLIEAKPDDMRTFLEEAAGVSKYKQKRKETESRIKNTKENLNRLNDIREEIEKQLRRLKTQSNAAKRYKKYKSREKEIHAEVLFTRINGLLSKLRDNQEEVQQHQSAFDQNLTELRKIEADIEEQRVADAEATQNFNNAQKDHFELQSKIARLEQSIEYEKELESQKSFNVQEIQKELERINKEHKEDSVQINQISSALSKLEQTIITASSIVNGLEQTLNELEGNLQGVSEQNESITNEINELNTVVETESVKISVLSKQMTQIDDQKRTIKNLHEAESIFKQLEKEIESSKIYFDPQSFEIITNKLDLLGEKLVSLSLKFQTIEQEITKNEGQIDSSKKNLKLAKGKLDELATDKEKLDQQKIDLSNEINTYKQKINSQRPSLQKLELKAESNRSTISALKNAMNRLESQKTQIMAKSLEITKGTRKKSDPTAEVKEQLESLLNHSLESEQTLNTLREQLEIIQATLRNYEIDRTNQNAKVNQSREILEKYKLSIRELEVRKEGLDDQLSANGYSYESIKESIVETLNETELEQELEKILRSMERLGPINLAASNEYEEEAKRKDNLDSQFDDLNRALDTLNGAIKQIDDESMKRFNETFEKVNIGLKKHFPRLFDGGKAYLELEKDDSLDAGVIVMARPPGKRNSNIHLLSGGEKALTAVALLFSIFELNPAPFCLLDEVDAPLDDTNVARFCEIVREMSESVQFVVITHNKTTMELTNQLIGVTMSEPGVSRLVTVDLDEAVALTEESQSA